MFLRPKTPPSSLGRPTPLLADLALLRLSCALLPPGRSLQLMQSRLYPADLSLLRLLYVLLTPGRAQLIQSRRHSSVPGKRTHLADALSALPLVQTSATP